MAFWNAPLEIEEQERKATECVLEMREALGELNERLREEGLDQINTGAGINTGLAVVGNFGSSNRFDYSVLGDSVNLAARLESSCKTYDTDLIISEYSLVDGYDYTFLDEVTVKGKSEPVKIYTIQKVIITTKKEVIQGEGFESNLDFSQYKLSMIHGVFDINVSSD